MKKFAIILLALLTMSIVLVAVTPMAYAGLVRFTRPVNATVTVVLVDLPVCGDLTGEGDVTTADAIRGLQIIVGLRQADRVEQFAGDLDKDGVITIIDVVTILQFVVEIIPAPTNCGVLSQSDGKASKADSG